MQQTKTRCSVAVILAVVLFAFLSMCVAENDSSESPTTVSGEQFNGVIFPASKGHESHLMTGGVSGYWSPTPSDVHKFESGLSDFLNVASNSPEIIDRGLTDDPQRRAYLSHEIAKIIDHLGAYRRQYCGVVIGGRRTIFANFFPDHHEDNSGLFGPWTEQFIQVEDGGYWYWRIFYAVDDAEYFGFDSNGYA